MANTLATLVVQFAADVAQFNADMGKAVKSAETRFGQITGAARKAAGAVGIAFGGLSLGELFKDAIAQAKEAEEASKRLSATLNATGHAAGLTKQQLDGMADAMAQSTQFDDESIRNAASQLLIFRNIQGDTFKETLKLSADVAAFFGMNIPEAAAKLAKSLEDPETAFGLLKRRGADLTEQQKDQIKAMGDLGDRAGQQRVVLDLLKGSFGGIAEEMNTGITKATSDLTKAWNELLESFGKSGPIQMAAQGGLLSIAAALNAVREAHDRASKQFAEKALAPGIHIAPGKELPMIPAGVTPGAFNDQLNSMGAPEIVSQEELRKRSTARLSAEAQRQQQISDAQYVKNRDAAKKAAAQAEQLLEKYRDKLRAVNDEMLKSEGIDSDFLKMKSLIANDKDFKAMSDSQKTALLDAAELFGIRKDMALQNTELAEGMAQVAKDSAAWSSKDISDLNELKQKYIDIGDPLQKYRVQLEEIARLQEKFPELNAVWTEAAFNINLAIDEAAGFNQKLKEVDSTAKDMAHAIGTAFEDAVIGGKKFSDVLKAIEQDIARIILRKTVTKPLEEAIGGFDFGDFFSGIFGDSGPELLNTRAAGGPVSSGRTYLVGEKGPELFAPDTAGMIVPNSALGGGGKTENNFTVDMRGASVDAVARLERLVASVNGSIERRALSVMSQARVRGVS